MSRRKDKSKDIQISGRMIDDVDRRIMFLLSERPEVSQAELSERLKISQPAVSLRMRKLQEKGILTHLIGIDIKKAPLFLAKVDIATNDVPRVLEALESCPLYLNCFLTSGRHNMTCLFMGAWLLIHSDQMRTGGFRTIVFLLRQIRMNVPTPSIWLTPTHFHF